MIKVVFLFFALAALVVKGEKVKIALICAFFVLFLTSPEARAAIEEAVKQFPQQISPPAFNL